MIKAIIRILSNANKSIFMNASEFRKSYFYKTPKVFNTANYGYFRKYPRHGIPPLRQLNVMSADRYKRNAKINRLFKTVIVVLTINKQTIPPSVRASPTFLTASFTKEPQVYLNRPILSKDSSETFKVQNNSFSSYLHFF